MIDATTLERQALRLNALPASELTDAFIELSNSTRDALVQAHPEWPMALIVAALVEWQRALAPLIGWTVVQPHELAAALAPAPRVVH